MIINHWNYKSKPVDNDDQTFIPSSDWRESYRNLLCDQATVITNVGDLGDLGSVMGSTAAACFFKSWTPRTTQFGSPDVSPSRCMVKAAVKLSVSPLRGKLLVLSLCVLLPTWRRSTSPFAAPRFRGTRLGQGRQGRQEDPLSRNALSPVIQAWQLQQERDREYDELLRGGFSKEKMLLGWGSMGGCFSLILFCWFSCVALHALTLQPYTWRTFRLWRLPVSACCSCVSRKGPGFIVIDNCC